MYDLVVVGAGPYGLSIASHAAAAGLELRVLGRPMASWRDHMPRGMFLKSEPWASNLSDPAGDHTWTPTAPPSGLHAEHGARCRSAPSPSTGCGSRRHAVPARRRADGHRRPPARRGGFRVDDGRRARRSAPGPSRWPSASCRSSTSRGRCARLPPGARSRTAATTRDLSRFRGKDVTVIGAGQAALETAALLAEQGARARVVARADRLNWNTPPPPLDRACWRSLRDPHSGLGTGWPNWVWAETPLGRPPAARPPAAAHRGTALGPAGAWWLRERFEPAVPVLLGHGCARRRRVRRGAGAAAT